MEYLIIIAFLFIFRFLWIADQKLKRLKDLIGPKDGAAEILDERPSERYITGILFLKELKYHLINMNKKTKLTDNLVDDDDDQENSIYKNFKPATCGISFVIGPKNQKLQ